MSAPGLTMMLVELCCLGFTLFCLGCLAVEVLAGERQELSAEKRDVRGVQDCSCFYGKKCAGGVKYILK